MGRGEYPNRGFRHRSAKLVGLGRGSDDHQTGNVETVVKIIDICHLS